MQIIGHNEAAAATQSALPAQHVSDKQKSSEMKPEERQYNEFEEKPKIFIIEEVDHTNATGKNFFITASTQNKISNKETEGS